MIDDLRRIPLIWARASTGLPGVSFKPTAVRGKVCEHHADERNPATIQGLELTATALLRDSLIIELMH